MPDEPTDKNRLRLKTKKEEHIKLLLRGGSKFIIKRLSLKLKENESVKFKKTLIKRQQV
jgi:hypothetical protein